jgi:hypothetical protein
MNIQEALEARERIQKQIYAMHLFDIGVDEFPGAFDLFIMSRDGKEFSVAGVIDDFEDSRLVSYYSYDYFSRIAKPYYERVKRKAQKLKAITSDPLIMGHLKNAELL